MYCYYTKAQGQIDNLSPCREEFRDKFVETLRQSHDWRSDVTMTHEMLAQLHVSCTDHATEGPFCPLWLLQRSQHVLYELLLAYDVSQE